MDGNVATGSPERRSSNEKIFEKLDVVTEKLTESAVDRTTLHGKVDLMSTQLSDHIKREDANWNEIKDIVTAQNKRIGILEFAKAQAIGAKNLLEFAIKYGGWMMVAAAGSLYWFVTGERPDVG